VGDIFDWFCSRFLPAAYTDEAASRGIHIMQLMNEKAGALKIGQSGVMALDWMNGNRSILQDANLTGLLVGLTLSTTPEEIYRACWKRRPLEPRSLWISSRHIMSRCIRSMPAAGLPKKCAAHADIQRCDGTTY
jgi:hypothetical protein